MNNKNVNALIARELSGFTCTRSLTMNSKFSIPHEAAKYGIENFEFIVSERVQVNPDNSRAMSALTCNYTMIYKNGERMRDFLGLFVFIVV